MTHVFLLAAVCYHSTALLAPQGRTWYPRLDNRRGVELAAHEPEIGGVRINKALKATHSRRAADALIADGRVTVNGKMAEAGTRLKTGDVVRLDDVQIDWERLNVVDGNTSDAPFVYIKLWKRRGIVCTTDRRQKRNILDSLGTIPGVSDRIYPIGRLDADSTGLILLTSDGSIVNGLLRASEKKSKEYLVSTDKPATEVQIAQLARGVTITTVAQRDGRSKPLTAPTKPCIVERLATGYDPCRLRFVLQEGRNRQIRRMCEACGLRVTRLHRIAFAGIRLDGLQAPGDWAPLTTDEVQLCKQTAIPSSKASGQQAACDHFHGDRSGTRHRLQGPSNTARGRWRGERRSTSN